MTALLLHDQRDPAPAAFCFQLGECGMRRAQVCATAPNLPFVFGDLGASTLDFPDQLVRAERHAVLVSSRSARAGCLRSGRRAPSTPARAPPGCPLSRPARGSLTAPTSGIRTA